MVISMPVAFNVPASGTIDYQYIVIPTGFTEDKYVQMAEARPGNPARGASHHRVHSRARQSLAEGRASPAFRLFRASKRDGRGRGGSGDKTEEAAEMAADSAISWPATLLEPCPIS